MLFVLSLTLLSRTTVAVPILHWKFDESSGATAADSAPTAGPDGGDNAGTLENFPSPTDGRWVTGVSGNALEFDGSNDRVIDDFSTDISPSSYTVALWARTSAPDQSLYNGLFSSRPTGGGSIDTFQIDTDGLGNYRFFTDNETGILSELSFGAVKTNTWQHLAAVADGSNLTLFVDGKETNSGTLAAGEAERLSAFVAGANRADSRYFDGVIDDIQFYDTSLSSSQISFIHANPGQLVPEPTLGGMIVLFGLIMLYGRRPEGAR